MDDHYQWYYKHIKKDIKISNLYKFHYYRQDVGDFSVRFIVELKTISIVDFFENLLRNCAPISVDIKYKPKRQREEFYELCFKFQHCDVLVNFSKDDFFVTYEIEEL